MTTLTYPYLGDAVKVGQALGCDPTGWPYRVENLQHTTAITNPSGSVGERWSYVHTEVTVEPWPIPGPLADEDEKQAYLVAMTHARNRMAGVIK